MTTLELMQNIEFSPLAMINSDTVSINIICLIYAFLINSIFAYTESPEDEEEFFYALTGNKRVVQITKEGESDQQIDQAVNLTLYRYDVILLMHILFSSVLSPF